MRVPVNTSILWRINDCVCIVLQGFYQLVRPVDQQCSQQIEFLSKWYCATPGVSVLARRFRLASNRYIVHKSANVKVCQYQIMTSNGFLKYFTINYVLNFLYVFSIKNPSMRNFSLQRIYNKKKIKLLWFCTCDKLHT